MSSKPEALPILNAEEHLWIERMAGRTLTNEEAQLLLREATLDAALASYAEKKLADGGRRG